MGGVFKRPAARRDLVAHYVYLAEHAGESVALRFLGQAEVSFAGLTEHPNDESGQLQDRRQIAAAVDNALDAYDIVEYLRSSSGGIARRLGPMPASNNSRVRGHWKALRPAGAQPGARFPRSTTCAQQAGAKVMPAAPLPEAEGGLWRSPYGHQQRCCVVLRIHL